MSLRLRELMAQMEIEGESIERTEHEAIEWQKILKRWPQIRDIEANFRVIQDACHPMDVTAESVALLLDDSTSQSLIHQLSLAEPEIIKRELIDKISELHGELTTATDVIKHRRKLMAFWTLEALRKELVRIESAANLQEKSTSELRQIVRQARPIPGYPALPREIVRPGTKKPVSLDATYIKQLDRDSLKMLIRKFSADAVNARLRGE